MLTVYFDTNFYAWLGSATADEADEAVDRLNATGVRYVLSDLVAAELAQAYGRAEQYARMETRLGRLEREPLRIPDDASWALLGGDEATRRETAGTMKWASNAIAATSAPALAIGRMNTSQTELFKSLHGIPDLSSPQEARTYLFSMLSQHLAPAFEEMGLKMPDFPTEFTPEALTAFGEKLRESFPGVEEAEALSAMEQAMTRTDNRVVQAALGDDQAAKRLGNTLRDSRHARCFVKNRDVINVFQVDGAQMRQVRSNPQHPLREAGLAERCFTASNLLDAVAKVEQLAASHRAT